MVEVVPIRVVIGLRPDGYADHPDWTQLPLQKERGERHEDHQIVKWVYDKTSGHDEETVDSPRGQQFGMMMVTQIFADEALVAFPGLITVLTEAQARSFWETKANAHLPENTIDPEYLVGLKAQRDLRVDLGLSTTAIDAEITRALDPGDSERGVKKNLRKKWADAKTRLDFTVKAGV